MSINKVESMFYHSQQLINVSLRITGVVATPEEIANPPTCTVQMRDGKCKADIFLIGTGCKMEFNYPDECEFQVQQTDENTYVVHSFEGVKSLSHLTPEYQ